MMKTQQIKKALFLLVLLSSGCEKEIFVDIPADEEKLVVEGFIEPGMPPVVFLTRNTGYFEPTDVNAIQNSIIKNADVYVNNGIGDIKLTQVCVDSIPASFLPYIAGITGLTADHLVLYNYCFYTTFDVGSWGEYGRTYTLSVQHNNKTYTSVSSIPEPVSLDSIWFVKKIPEGSLGTLWAKLSDPPGVYNAYRIFTKRIGKDESFIPAWGSVFEDDFFDGKIFDFYFFRGIKANSERTDDTNSERAYYKEGDTIAVKFCTIDQNVYKFIRDLETEVSNNGNPFAAPMTIHSNISNGGLGYWGGYGAVYDTIIAFENK